MPNKAVDFNDFCRRWLITNRGTTPWPSRIAKDAQFAIVRNVDRYQYIRLKGVGGAKTSMPLKQVLKGAYGQGHDGDKLEGALTARFDGNLYLFTLNEIKPGQFEISISQDSAPLHTVERRTHGGPHGVDN